MTNKNDIPASETKVAARGFEDIHLVVPKTVADQFRRVAKKSKLPANTLFEEMVALYANGMGFGDE